MFIQYSERWSLVNSIRCEQLWEYLYNFVERSEIRVYGKQYRVYCYFGYMTETMWYKVLWLY